MGDTLKRTTLAALCSRGPWNTSTWDSATRRSIAVEITGDEIRRIYERIAAGDPIEKAVPWGGSDRRSDRALQLLRKSHLIEFTGTPKRWRVCGATTEIE